MNAQELIEAKLEEVKVDETSESPGMQAAAMRAAPSIESSGMQAVHDAIKRGYEHGFTTDIETESFAKGLSEAVVRAISAKKGEPEWLTAWRVKAYHHWLTMTPPNWAQLEIAAIDFQDLSYYAAPKKNLLKSMDEVDPKLLATFEKLGVPLHERARLAGVAVDAVFDSVSVGTTFKKELNAAGVLFCSFSEAVKEHSE